ncbi:TPA: hypothetical protein ACQTZN_006804 [Pseudomonas aeruginosa]
MALVKKSKNQRSCKSFLLHGLLQQKARIFLVTSQETSMASMRAQRQFTSFRVIGQNRLFLRRFQNPRLRLACCFGAPVFLVSNSIVLGQFAAAHGAGILAKNTGLTGQSTGTVKSCAFNFPRLRLGAPYFER